MEKTLHFCTYFDSNYLAAGLTLYRSLTRHARPFHLWVLCFDEQVYRTLQTLSFPEISPISQGDFEKGDIELLQAKGNRSRIEYYFTCSSSLPIFIFRNHPEVDVITYLDADLFFFSEPYPIFQELGDSSILIMGHRFPPQLKYKEIYGVYNVGLFSFRRDSEGLRCLQSWREQCLEWCCDRVETGRFADQKYLDDWPERFSRVVVLQHKGAGLAPWNVTKYRLSVVDNRVLVDADPLVFFHFSGLRRVWWRLYKFGLAGYGARVDSVLKQYIYIPYIWEIRETNRWLSRTVDGYGGQVLRSIRGSSAGNPWKIMGKVTKLRLLARNILKGDLQLVIGRRIP